MSSYFQSYQNYFWQWEEDGEVIAITEGKTIAYKTQLVEVFESFRNQGIPRFSSLVLALVALNTKGVENVDAVYALIEQASNLNFSYENDHSKPFLLRLANLPEAHKTRRNKLILLRAIFNNCHNSISSSRLPVILHQCRTYSTANLPDPQVIDQEGFRQDLRVLDLLGRKFPTTQSIIDAITNLPELDKDLDLEIAIDTDSKDLIDELIEDQRTQKVGTLIKTIWSGINLPFHSSVPSQQPIGGASDLTNRGSFDQLLISEYANEDLIFLSRLANNEVLYLNRESPPVTNDLTRVLLIDISIKNWGTPKIISFATMLAIAKHPKSKINCEVFVIGNTVNHLEIDSVTGIAKGLGFVEIALNAGMGLKQFFENNLKPKGREIFVLTERSTPSQNSFHQAINEFGDQIDYWVYTDGNGHIDLYKNSKKSKKHIQHLEIPLERLWSEKQKVVATKNQELEDFYPILLAKNTAIKGFRTTRNGEVFLLDKEKNLLRLHNKHSNVHDEAWDVFHQNLPISNTEFDVGLHNNGDYICLSYNRLVKRVFITNLRTKEVKNIAFEHWKQNFLADFVFHENKFYHFNNKGAWSIDADGEVETTTIDLVKVFEKQQERLKELAKKYSNYQQVLKNVRRVAINENGNLMINNFELKINSGGHIKLESFQSQAIACVANKERSTTFKFDDGSIIEVIRTGLVRLRSSNATLPTIYFPSIVDASISIATPNSFAGNERYRKYPLYELILKNSGDTILQVIKSVKEITDFGLLEVRTIVESVPSNLGCFFSYNDAQEGRIKLEEVGAKVEIIQSNSGFNELEKIEPQLFFDLYMRPFITTILSHGN